LDGGDDYELRFTAHPADRGAVEAAGRACCIAITRIGTMTKAPSIRLEGDPGIDVTLSGFDHFAGTPEA